MRALPLLAILGGLCAESYANEWESMSLDDIKVKYRLYGFQNCPVNQRNDILQALSEKHTITGASGVQNINWHSAAAVDFFGPPSTLQTDSRRYKIQQNFWRAYNFGNGWWGSGHNIQIFCGDGSLEGRHKHKCERSDHIFLVKKYADDNDAMMFCNSWFELPTLKEVYSKVAQTTKRLDISKYDNRAMHWISALLEKEDIGFFPRLRLTDKLLLGHRTYETREYGVIKLNKPATIKYLAKRRLDDFSDKDRDIRLWSNSDTYSWAAMALWLQEVRQLGHYPAYPYVPKDPRADRGWIASEEEEREHAQELMGISRNNITGVPHTGDRDNSLPQPAPEPPKGPGRDNSLPPR